jgi:beta propeller repeat protein
MKQMMVSLKVNLIMNKFLLIFALFNFSIQLYGQTATTLIEVLDPFVMHPTMPAISGNSVVFIDYRNYKYSIFDVNIITKQERILVPNPGYTEPQIRLSDNRMAWVGYPSITQADLYLRDITSNITTRITEDAAFQNYPDIHKKKIVWQDYRNAGTNYKNADIYFYDILSGETKQITTDPSYQTLPSIWENYIVWEDHRNAYPDTTNADIYLYNLLTNEEIQITSEPSAQLNPRIWEKKIVWEDYRNGTGDIYMFDISTNTEKVISTFNAFKSHPVIYGNWIVWQDYRNGPYADIYGFNLATNKEYPVIIQPHHQDFAVLDSLNLIWQDFQNNRQDLYRAVLKNEIGGALTLISPNGGENWHVGKSYPITWSSVNVSSVRLDYSTNNGSSWIIIEPSVSSNSYNWTIPNNPSAQCRVRITDINNSMVTDQSDGMFTISEAPSVSVVTPNGGEDWRVGSTQLITWNRTNVSDVKLEYTNNNGSSWTVILPSTSSNSYNWTIPNNPSAQCRVRITDINNSMVTDQSDGMFTISEVPSITVISPNGGEDWEVGSTHEISWYYTNVKNVKIEYSTNNGNSWFEITASTPGNGIYLWTVPNTPSTQCRVRIIDVNSAASDISNDVFMISSSPNPILTVATPNGGEHYEPGSTVTIKWVSQDVNYIKIDYSSNNGTDWNSVVSDIPASEGSYDWVTPYIESDDYLIRVCDVFDPGFCDQSDSTFRIAPISEIEIISPNGGEVWQIGSSVNIIWISSNVLNVKIQLSIDNGSSWVDIISSLSNSGTYPWVITSSPSFQSLIRISDVSDLKVYDISDNVFTIEEAPLLMDEFFVSRIPDEFKLHQNFPNPFNNSTSIYYSISQPSFVKLEIFTLLGEKIAQLVGEHRDAGNYLERFNFDNYNSGIYIGKMQAGNYMKTIKMILLK